MRRRWSSLIYERIDVAVGQFLGTEQAGLYGPASTITTSLFLIPSSAYAVMAPVMTRAFATDRAGFESSLRLFLGVNGAGRGHDCDAGGVGAVVGEDGVRQRFRGFGRRVGDPGAGAGAALRHLCTGGGDCGRGFADAADLGASGVGVVGIVVNLVVVQRWGIEGVAWVYVLTEFVLMLGYWRVLAPLKSAPTIQASLSVCLSLPSCFFVWLRGSNFLGLP
ncbi:MAG: hypothetical protein R2856_20310 [Caldilineaceae bacterium]